MLGSGIPVIAVAISGKSGPSVAVDGEQAAYDAIRHLLALGHRRIGFLAGDQGSIYVAQPRQRGYFRAMVEAKCTPVTPTGRFSYESGARGLDSLLDQEPGRTAIFARSGETDVAVVNELQCRDRRVPGDVSALGFDDTSTSLHVRPPLSTVAHSIEDMGRMSVKRLLAPAISAPNHAPQTHRNAAPPHHPRPNSPQPASASRVPPSCLI